MAVHVPLSQTARMEAGALMSAENNLLKPSDSGPEAVPKKEMVLGIYYYTSVDDRLPLHVGIFASQEEAIAAYQQRVIQLRQKIKVMMDKTIIETTVGRIFTNQMIPSQVGYINDTLNIGKIKGLINKSLDLCTNQELSDLLDNLKNIGFIGSMDSGISFGIFDLSIDPQKNGIIAEGEAQAAEYEDYYHQGLITVEEMRRNQIDVWMAITDKIADLTWSAYEKENPVKIIQDSGAGRSSRDNLKQISGMRGLMSDPTGKVVAMPTKSNFREGLSVFEYVTGTRGTRKGLADTALRTADAGYLTRSLYNLPT
jgi:DNA-directed RNA polymerase subunit beta'